MGNWLSDLFGDETLEAIKSARNGTGGEDINIAIIGPSASGKSTVFKMIKKSQPDGSFTQKERVAYVSVIHANALQNAQDLVAATHKFKYWSQEFNKLEMELESMPADIGLDQTRAKILTRLWSEKCVQEAFRRCSEAQLAESTAYFFENLDRISSPKYVPTDEDILRTRVRTSGIHEFSFQQGGVHYKLFDLGGSRTERKKWFHVLDQARAVIFVASLSDYDQFAREDDSGNRMKETLDLFGDMCNSRFFETSKMILVLNKRDLLEKKLKSSPLEKQFPDYKGTTVDEAVSFISEMFLGLNPNPEKVISLHVTCATSEPPHFLFKSVLHNAPSGLSFIPWFKTSA